MFMETAEVTFFCDTPKHMRQIAFVIRDVITHTILSVKGQLNGNSQETANFVLFFLEN